MATQEGWGRCVFARVYREDEAAEEDLSLIVSREQPPDPIETDSVSGKEILRDEWLVSTLEKGGHYSVDAEERHLGPSGEVERITVTKHFQVIDMAHGSSRPRALGE